jgi:hypothetical protein
MTMTMAIGAGWASSASAQSAPEEFGNPWMARLQEVAPPEPAPWWPPAPGWYALGALLLLVLLWILWRGVTRWRANAYRREALQHLHRLEARALSEGGARALAELPALLKRVALASFPRAEVASVTGDAWLGFLDGNLGTTEFTRGAGRRLSALAYDQSSAVGLSPEDARALIRLARRWVRRHPKVSPC